MPNLYDFPRSFALLAAKTCTTTGTSDNLTLPLAQSYRFTVELLTASSTTTNFNLALFSSDDAGTTYHGIMAFTALTTSGQALSFCVRPYLGVGDNATTVTSCILGSTDYATNVNVLANGPFDPRYIKARYVAVTNGTVTFNLKCCALQPGEHGF